MKIDINSRNIALFHNFQFIKRIYNMTSDEIISSCYLKEYMILQQLYGDKLAEFEHIRDILADSILSFSVEPYALSNDKYNTDDFDYANVLYMILIYELSKLISNKTIQRVIKSKLNLYKSNKQLYDIILNISSKKHIIVGLVYMAGGEDLVAKLGLPNRVYIRSSENFINYIGGQLLKINANKNKIDKALMLGVDVIDDIPIESYICYEILTDLILEIPQEDISKLQLYRYTNYNLANLSDDIIEQINNYDNIMEYLISAYDNSELFRYVARNIGWEPYKYECTSIMIYLLYLELEYPNIAKDTDTLLEQPSTNWDPDSKFTLYFDNTVITNGEMVNKNRLEDSSLTETEVEELFMYYEQNYGKIYNRYEYKSITYTWFMNLRSKIINYIAAEDLVLHSFMGYVIQKISQSYKYNIFTYTLEGSIIEKTLEKESELRVIKGKDIKNTVYKTLIALDGRRKIARLMQVSDLIDAKGVGNKDYTIYLVSALFELDKCIDISKNIIDILRLQDFVDDKLIGLIINWIKSSNGALEKIKEQFKVRWIERANYFKNYFNNLKYLAISDTDLGKMTWEEAEKLDKEYENKIVS